MLFLLLLTGCALGNTPTSRVEELLSSYQRLDKNIVISYEKLSSTVEDANLISEYQKLVKRQYQNMVYEIKDEKINGDLAIVSVSISVFDYGSVVNDNFDDSVERTKKEHEEIIRKLKKVKKRIQYMLDLEVVKNQNGTWEVGDLDDDEMSQLLGIYS